MAILDLLPPFLLGLIEPGFLLYYAIAAYVKTLLFCLLRERTIPTDLRGRAFGAFWSQISGTRPDPQVPLVGSMALVPGIFAEARGTVLEIGPGSGNQTHYYEPAIDQIKVIYGAEPAKELHAMLKRNINDTELKGKYSILSADATKASIGRELMHKGVVKTEASVEGLFDTIICVRVLCSVPNLDGVVSDLHSLLKPGGQLLVLEHTANPWRSPKGSVVARLVQTMYMLLGWKYFVGDCSLTQDIEEALRHDAFGRWETVTIERHFGKKVLTYISGALIRR